MLLNYKFMILLEDGEKISWILCSQPYLSVWMSWIALWIFLKCLFLLPIITLVCQAPIYLPFLLHREIKSLCRLCICTDCCSEDEYRPWVELGRERWVVWATCCLALAAWGGLGEAVPRADSLWMERSTRQICHFDSSSVELNHPTRIGFSCVVECFLRC